VSSIYGTSFPLFIQSWNFLLIGRTGSLTELRSHKWRLTTSYPLHFHWPLHHKVFEERLRQVGVDKFKRIFKKIPLPESCPELEWTKIQEFYRNHGHPRRYGGSEFFLLSCMGLELFSSFLVSFHKITTNRHVSCVIQRSTRRKIYRRYSTIPT
jgi:hypothetical protein